MKTKANVARERIEAQVVTLPDGRKCATGPLGVALLFDKPAIPPSIGPRKALADIRKLVDGILANDGWEYGAAAMSIVEAIKAILDRVDGGARW